MDCAVTQKLLFPTNKISIGEDKKMLTDEMKEAIEKNLVFVATASSDGTPNVVPIGFT